MQSISNGVGVTQFNGMRPKNSINIGGVTWTLRRDATDAVSYTHLTLPTILLV